MLQIAFFFQYIQLVKCTGNLYQLFLDIFSCTADKTSRTRKLKHAVIEAINELISDIDTCHEQISEQAVEHIHQKYLLSFQHLQILSFQLLQKIASMQVFIVQLQFPEESDLLMDCP